MGLLSLFGSADRRSYVNDELLAKDLSGQVAIVTGATGSFGSVLSEALVKQGALVILAVRRLEAGKELATAINAKGYPGKASASLVDLSDLESVKDFCSRFMDEHSSLHILVENAAVCCVGNSPNAKSGFEPHLAANHYGHIYMRHHLESLLAASAPSRVVVVASALHDRMFTQEPTTLDLDADAAYLGWTKDPKIDQLKQWMAYSRSKLCNVLSALAASERLASKGVAIVSLHPGVDPSTSLFRAMPKGAFMMRIFGRFIGIDTTHQSVQTILYCCLEDHEKLKQGAYYSQYYAAGYRDGQHGAWPMASPNPLVTAENAAKLETLSYKALGLTPPIGLKDGAGEQVGYEPNVMPTPPTSEAVSKPAN